MKTRIGLVALLAALALIASLAGLRGAAAQANDAALIDITTLAQLDAMRYDLNGDGSADSPANAAKYNAAFPGVDCPNAGCEGYELKNNLDFDTDGDKDVDANDSYPKWTPIGDDAKPFTATFDGGGNSITRLTVNDGSVKTGLFGRLRGATVKNLALTNADIRSASSALNSGSGALAGSATGTISSVRAAGTVSGSAKNMGGLVGIANPATLIEASWTDVAVSSSGAQAKAGGLVGAANSVRIFANYALGDVSVSGFQGKAGGLVGLAKGGNMKIRASYARGGVSATGDRSTAGGLLGISTASAANRLEITASYSAGAVSASRTTGAFIGSGNAVISRSFWDATTSGIEDDSDGDAPEGRTTAQLQNPTAASGVFANWNRLDLTDDNRNNPTNAPWDFGTRSQYPVLVWRGLTAASQRAGGGGAADAPATTATPAPTPTPRADADVDRIYRDSAQIAEYLAADRPALSASASAIFREYLASASASHVEKRVKTALLDYARESTGGNERMARFIDSAITRGGGYHTLFAWDSANAQSFWQLFGDAFGANLKDAVNGDAALSAGAAAFIELADDRDRLTRGEMGASAYAKTSAQIRAAYQSALTFAESLPRLLSENGG